ncbi:hypothetical protein AgCh_022960 [Apium graveolens]
MVILLKFLWIREDNIWGILGVDVEVCKVTKRDLDIDDGNGGGADKGYEKEGKVKVGKEGKVKVSKSEKNRISEGESSEKKEKIKVKGSFEDGKLKENASNKRREEKKLVGLDLNMFLLCKSISSLLEKIRQRKLKISKKISVLNDNGYST